MPPAASTETLRRKEPPNVPQAFFSMLAHDASGAAATSAAPQVRPRRRGIPILVAAGIVAVVAVAATVLLATGAPSGPSGSPSSNVVLATGDYAIGSGSSMTVKFQESAPFTLVGAWTAETSRGTLTFLLLNDSEYNAFNATGNLEAGYQVLEPNATGNVDLNLPIPAGEWVFLLVNYDEYTVNVDVTQAVAALT